jgi:hypothetical protein
MLFILHQRNPAMSNTKPNSLDAQLLNDLKSYFARQQAKHYQTEQLLASLASLAGIDGAPWATFTEGKAITARHLARLLQPYGIVPKTIRFMGGLAKGYNAADFNDAFASSFVTDKVTDIVDVTDRIESAKVDVTDRRPVLADSVVTDSDVTDKLADIVDVTDRNVADNSADNPVAATVADNPDGIAANVVTITRAAVTITDNLAAPAQTKPQRKAWPPPKGWAWNYQTKCYEPPKPTEPTVPLDQETIRQTLRIAPNLKYRPGYGLVALHEAEPCLS